MQITARSHVSLVNPLVGHSTLDTIENLLICLNNVSECFAARHDDPAIVFFCSTVAAALRYEQNFLATQTAHLPLAPSS